MSETKYAKHKFFLKLLFFCVKQNHTNMMFCEPRPLNMTLKLPIHIYITAVAECSEWLKKKKIYEQNSVGTQGWRNFAVLIGFNIWSIKHCCSTHKGTWLMLKLVWHQSLLTTYIPTYLQIEERLVESCSMIDFWSIQAGSFQLLHLGWDSKQASTRGGRHSAGPAETQGDNTQA